MNSQKENTTEELEREVLAAAAALGTELSNEIKYKRQESKIETKLADAKSALTDAEFELAAAEMNISDARFQVMSCEKAIKTYKSNPAVAQTFAAIEDARKLLWTISVTGDAEAILKAAYAYGEQTTTFWQMQQELKELDTNLQKALESQRNFGQARKIAVQKRDLASGVVQEIETELKNLFAQMRLNTCNFFNHRALVNAAMNLTHTRDQCFAYSYVETKNLDINLPDED